MQMMEKSKRTTNSCKESNSEIVAKTTKNPPPKAIYKGKNANFYQTPVLMQPRGIPIGYLKSPIGKKIVPIGVCFVPIKVPMNFAHALSSN